MPRTFDLVGVGLNATDTAIIVPEWPEYAGKIAFLEERMEAGGQVATAVIACRALGKTCRYIGTVGDDVRGLFQLDSLRRSGVDITGVVVIPGCPNQTAYIIIDRRTGERTVLWYRDDRLALRPGQLDHELVCSGRVLHVDGHDLEATATAARWAREAGIPVTCDVDTMKPDMDRLIQHVDYFIASASFPEAYTSEKDPFKALEILRGEFGMKMAAMTLGHDGVLALTAEGFLYSPAYEVDCVDTTGAGDTFRGCFAYALLEGQPLQNALDFACAGAALNCTAMGARGGIASLPQVQALMKKGSRRVNPAYCS
jgi:sugar/nucleoside kinase (ribokinase family)